MKLKKLICLVALVILIATSASANTYTYAFSLNGAGGNPPNNSPGVAFGTLTLTDPDVLTLDITYASLSSDLTQVNCFFSLVTFGVNVEFYAGDLPPSGHWINTEHFPIGDIMQSISAGHANLQVGTINHPIGSFGEIGGYFNPVPVDSDGDGVFDDQDQCPDTAPGVVVNEHGCSIEQLAPCGRWRNHGQYVAAVAKVAQSFLRAGLITNLQRNAIVRAAARSNCGRR